MERYNLIHTSVEKCEGCNKCIFKCPARANEAFLEADDNKVFIKAGYCISCGECIAICDHDARDYKDDTLNFFEDIKAGEQISVVIAPAAHLNFEDVRKLIGYLKEIGVKGVYDVSLGADICTWAHVKAIKEQNITSIISQPCPAIVSYVEKFHPELIERLSPIQSPLLCLGIYLKKYLGIKEKLAFLSPCIEKKEECTDENTMGYIDYNVTIAKFLEYIENEGVNLDKYQAKELDIADGSLGFTFPRPGGLAENIEFHLGEKVWIKGIEGIFNIEEYFLEYLDDLKNDRPVPLLIDALNCEHGCNLGTGTRKNIHQNEIDYKLNQRRKEVKREDLENMLIKFNETLVLSDFYRQYMDKSDSVSHRAEIDLEKAFMLLGKNTPESRNINCFSCGYGNCVEFAQALATGHNHRNNCKYYLLDKFKKLSTIDDLTGLKNRYSYTQVISKLKKKHPEFVGVAFIDINGLKEANDNFSHAYGDAMIITCAKLLLKVFGSKAYRLGGDEFIVIDDKTNYDEFKDKVDELSVMIDDEDDLVVSIGIASSFSSVELESAIKYADQNMYQAKEKYYMKNKNVDRRKR